MTTTSPGTESSELAAITCAAKTDIGMRREENQDSYGIIECASSKYYIVADGMGGVKGGAVASQLAIRIHEELLRDVPRIVSEDMSRAANAANAGVFDRGVEDPSLAGMGTTLVGLCFTDSDLFVINVGDSRAYRIRHQKITQLTEDHTLVTELLRSGAIRPDQVENHPVSHMLTRSLGPTPMVEIDCWKDALGPAKGDKYLLCSDGLYNMVSSEEIAQIVSNNDGEQAVSKLVELANERGGTDNITVIIITVDDTFPIDAAVPEEPEASDSVTDTLELHDTLELTEGLIAEVTAELDEERLSEGGGYQNGANGCAPSEDGSESPEIRSSVSAESLAREALSRDQQDANDQSPEDGDDGNSAGGDSDPALHRDELPTDDLQLGTAVTEKLMVPRRGVFSQGLLPVVLLVVISVALGILGTLYVGSTGSTAPSPIDNPQPPVVAIDESDEEPVEMAAVDPAVDAPEVEPPVVEPPTMTPDSEDDQIGLDAIEQEPEEATLPTSVLQSTEEDVEDDSPLPSPDDVVLQDDSHGLSIIELEKVSKRKTTLEQMIKRFDEQITSFEKPLSGDSGEALTTGSVRLDELRLELESVKDEIDVATRRLTVWYGRRQRLQTVKEIELAKEISVASEQVKAKQAEFEQVTWLYYKELESYQLDRDAGGEAKVRSLSVQRKAAMKELAKAVRTAIKEEVESADRRIAELTTKRHALEAKIESQERDLEYVRALLSHDPILKEQKKRQLVERRTVAIAELAELNELVPDEETVEVPTAASQSSGELTGPAETAAGEDASGSVEEVSNGTPASNEALLDERTLNESTSEKSDQTDVQ